MDILSTPEIQYFLQLILAFFLGALVGVEREYVGKEAGMRTFSLISLSSALFTILSREGFLGISEAFDPSRVAAGIVIGIGFVGTGVIIFRGSRIEGLTTAAALWTAGAVGMAVGCELYFLAIVTTVITLVILILMKEVKIEEKGKK